MGLPLTRLGDATTAELARAAPGLALLVPLGATEQHGPHLPLDTDTRLAAAVAALAAARPELAGRALVAPALPYGSSGEHGGFPGTLSIGQAALELVLVELCRSVAAPFTAVALVNGHGGNAEPVGRAVAALRAEGRDVTAWWPRAPGGDAHAGRTETSLLLALDPAAVRLDRAAAGAAAPLPELLPALRAGGVAAVSPNGVLGDPAGASAAEGHQLLDRFAADLAEVVAARLAAAPPGSSPAPPPGATAGPGRPPTGGPVPGGHPA